MNGGAARYLAQRLGLLALFAGLLFAAAGTAAWPRGWAYLAAALALEAATLALLAARAPETLRQRGAAHAGVAPFDRIFAVAWLALSLATAVVAGLDARCEATALSWAWFWLGLALLLPAGALGAWAMLENPHFESFVRIQTERGHRVVRSGPYAWLRHPGYLAAIAGALVTPGMLGSLWSIVPAGGIALLFAVRTKLEDDTLQRELPGYAAYAGETRFRLVPGVW